MNKKQALISALHLAVETLEMRCVNPGLPYLMTDSQRDGEKIAKQVDNIVATLSKRIERLEGI